MPERPRVTPIEASVILLNEVFGRAPHDPKIAEALHGYGWRHRYNRYISLSSGGKESITPDVFLSDPSKSRLLLDSVDQALNTLTLREKAFIEARFGFTAAQIPTLTQLGQQFALTSGEQPRQLVFKALRRLRHPSRSKGLRQFLPENQT